MQLLNSAAKNSDAILRNVRAYWRPTAAVGALVLCLGLMAISIPGCNTVEGAGRDVEAAGDAVADTAEDAKN